MQVNYLHSHGLAHTELRLENVHVSPIDKHVKVSSLSLCLYLCKLSSSVVSIMLHVLLWTLNYIFVQCSRTTESYIAHCTWFCINMWSAFALYLAVIEQFTCINYLHCNFYVFFVSYVIPFTVFCWIILVEPVKMPKSTVVSTFCMPITNPFMFDSFFS